MPSATEEHIRVTAPGRKRRRENDGDLQIQGPLYEKLAQYSAAASNNRNADRGYGRLAQQQQQQQHQPHSSLFPHFPSNERIVFHHGGLGIVEEQQRDLNAVPRKIAPLPAPKRQRMFEDEEEGAGADEWGDGTSLASTDQRRRHSKSYSSQQQQQSSRVQQDQTDTTDHRPKTHSSLSPCHICHRRPTKKSDLDSFADCQGCGQRTCFVCIRECEGWRKDEQPGNGDDVEQQEDVLSRSFHMDDVDDDRQRQQREGQQHEHYVGTAEGQTKRHDGWSGGGHRKMICSRCCIEKGAEGDVICLGCLSRMEAV